MWYDNWYGDYTEHKYYSYKIMHALPVFRELIDMNIANERTKRYMERYHLDYSDIVNPSALYDADNGQKALGALNYASSNIRKLYR